MATEQIRQAGSGSGSAASASAGSDLRSDSASGSGLAGLGSLVDLERHRVRAQLRSLQRTFDELVEHADLEPADDEHDPDGTTAYERAQVVSMIEELKVVLGQLDTVMHRIDEGTVDVCSVCGGPIGVDRLLAIPATSVCVRCAAGVPALG